MPCLIPFSTLTPAALGFASLEIARGDVFLGPTRATAVPQRGTGSTAIRQGEDEPSAKSFPLEILNAAYNLLCHDTLPSYGKASWKWWL
jgi:hypothetical protein